MMDLNGTPGYKLFVLNYANRQLKGILVKSYDKKKLALYELNRDWHLVFAEFKREQVKYDPSSLEITVHDDLCLATGTSTARTLSDDQDCEKILKHLHKHEVYRHYLQ